MISGNSFFTVRRSVYDHYLFEGDAFSRRDAWLWIISEAAFSERKVSIGNKVVNIARGEAIHSIRSLAKTWQWGEKKVRIFLDLLEAEGMIKRGTVEGKAGARISVCNYDVYQSPSNDNDTIKGTAGAQLGHNYNNYNNINNNTRARAHTRESDQIDLEETISAKQEMANALTGNYDVGYNLNHEGFATLSDQQRQSWIAKFGTAEKLDAALIEISDPPIPKNTLAQAIAARLARVHRLQVEREQDRKARQKFKPQNYQNQVEREEAVERAYFENLRREHGLVSRHA